MMKIISSLILLVIALGPAAAQQGRPSSPVTDDEFQTLLIAVSSEGWDKAVELSTKFLKQMKEDDERLPRLRYIYLYSAAGKVSEGRMEFDELARLANELVGERVVLPYRPLTLECKGAMNFICPSGNSKTKLLVGAANKTGTTIFAFEYVQLKEPFDFVKHVDEPASVIGNIEAIVPNPNKSRMFVMRLYIADAILELKNSPSKQLP